jgi:outer membrane biosynthesis protein TonB
MGKALRSEERVGLAVALAGHVALAAWLVFAPARQAPIPTFERTEVTLADEVSLTSTAPDPSDLAAAQQAPQLGEDVPAPQPQPQPQPVTVATSPPVAVAPAPAPVRAQPAPAPKPQPQQPVRAAPAPQPAVKPATKPATKPGGSRIGADFLKGVAAPAASTGQGTPAAAIGPAVRSSLAGAISRQLKPRWVAPQGADAELLVTILAWDMNPDGSLKGAPHVVRQEGITDANRAQASRHAEQAIRAVRLAAPFDLPDQYYDAWKRVASFRFDRKLSQ